jgi:monovalent cation:H+ antiporter-2, CPA2 family
VAFFFVAVGMLLDPGTWRESWPIILLLVGLVLAGKFVVWTGVVWMFRYPFRTSLRVGLGLTQIGEFSFILAQVSMKAGLISADVYHATLAASLITILANATIFRFVKPTTGNEPVPRTPAASHAAG